MALSWIQGYRGEWPGADPGDAFRLLADLDLADRLVLNEIDKRHGTAVVIGDDQRFAVGRDIHQAVAGSSEADGSSNQKR